MLPGAALHNALHNSGLLQRSETAANLVYVKNSSRQGLPSVVIHSDSR